MDARPASGVQSVARAAELLEVLRDAGRDVMLSEMAASTGLALPTIHRLLRTLVTLGYVRQLPTRRYALGARLITLGDAASQQLGTLAMPQLANLVKELGETANMAMLDRDMVVYVAQVPSGHSMRMFTEIGRHVHTHASGVGKAILAQLDDHTVQGIVTRAGMPTPTGHTLGTVGDLLADLGRARSRGFSIDDNEQEIGVRCFAVAVPGMVTPTAISVSGPVSRIDDGFAARAIPLLHAAAQVIGEQLA